MPKEDPKSGPPSKSKAQVNIKVSDDQAKGTYANVAVVHNNDLEFVFDFVFMEPHRGQGHVVSRIISNPRTAKRLMLGLQDIIANYEKRFGEIPIPKAGPPKSTYH